MTAVPDHITFRHASAAVGQVIHRTVDEETQLAFAPMGPYGEPVPVFSTTKSRRVRREEVLAVRDGVAVRLRVSFFEDLTTVDTNGDVERRTGPLAGQTYEVERRADRAAVVVYESSGQPARFDVESAVAAEYRDLGRPRPLEGELPVGPQKIGNTPPGLLRAFVAGIASGTGLTKVEVPSVTLAEIRPASDGSLHGVFNLGVRVTGASEGSDVVMTLSGTLVVRDVDGAMLQAKLHGPMTVEPEAPLLAPPGGQAPATAAGAGQFQLTETDVYSRV